VETIADHILESPSAREHAGEPIAAPGDLPGSERLPIMVSESATAPSATVEMGAEKLSESNEQTAVLDSLEGMVRTAIRPLSPKVVPPTAMEEDEVEEIVRDEPQPQAVQILRKRGEEIVIVEEEDTTKEFRRLETSLTGVMKQIKVNTSSGKVLVVYWNWLIMSSNLLQEISRVAEQRRQLIKRMEPLAVENEKLKEARNLSEKNIQRAQHERDLAESNAHDLEYQKGVLTEKLAAVSEQVRSQAEQLAAISDQLKCASEQLERKSKQLNSVSK